MRDEYGGAVAHDAFYGLLDEVLGLGINRTRRLVENEERGVAGQRTRETDQLLLPDRQPRAALAHFRLEAFRQFLYKRVRVHFARSPSYALIRHLVASEPDVAFDRAAEQENVL